MIDSLQFINSCPRLFCTIADVLLRIRSAFRTKCNIRSWLLSISALFCVKEHWQLKVHFFQLLLLGIFAKLDGWKIGTIQHSVQVLFTSNRVTFQQGQSDSFCRISAGGMDTLTCTPHILCLAFSTHSLKIFMVFLNQKVMLPLLSK